MNYAYSRDLGEIQFSHARSATASYQTAARLRERLAILKIVKALLNRIDPDDLIPRPIDEDGWVRLVNHFIQRTRSRVNAQFNLRDFRPRLRWQGEETRGERAIRFIETKCRVPEGPRAGQPMVLDEFEKAFIIAVLDNPAITKEAILSMAKKNGKTGLIAALLLVFLVGPEAKLPNSQIVSGAMERKQAGIVLKYATKMVQFSPELCWVVRPVSKHLYGLPRNVEFTALAAVAESTHGISPIVAIMDEIGQVEGPTSDFVSAIETSQGAYDDALRIIISTQAANDGDLLSLKIDRALQSKDPKIVCHLYTADPNCDLLDEVQWRKANPGLGTIRSIPDMRDLAKQAVDLPSFAASFRNLNLNQRVRSTTGLFSPDAWMRCAEPPAKMEGQVVWCGLDLSETTDLCALVVVSSAGDVWPFFWLPDEGLAERQRHDKVPYVQWRDEGYLLTTPGPTVEYEHVAEFLRGVFDKATVTALAFDRFNMKHLMPWLKKAEFTDKELEKFKEFGQGFVSMSPAIRDLESKVLNKKLKHGNHPILTWNAANVAIERDPAGNRKFNKARARHRIDGLVALTMAIGVMPPEQDKRKFQMVIL